MNRFVTVKSFILVFALLLAIIPVSASERQVLHIRLQNGSAHLASVEVLASGVNGLVRLPIKRTGVISLFRDYLKLPIEIPNLLYSKIESGDR